MGRLLKRFMVNCGVCDLLQGRRKNRFLLFTLDLFRERSLHGTETTGCAKHLHAAVLSLASNLSSNDPQLAAEYGLCSGRFGHV